jgi:hypothetical protein
MKSCLGLYGSLICNVNDDPALIQTNSMDTINFNRNNLPTFETPRRVERLVPPMGFWHTHGIRKYRLLLIQMCFDFGVDIKVTDVNDNNNNKNNV